MEHSTSSSTVVYRSLQSYWRQRARRLPEDVAPARKTVVVRLGTGGRGRRGSWKMVAARPALRMRQVRVSAPRKLLAGLRDAYMNAMLLLAGGKGLSAKKGGGGLVWDRRVPRARQASLRDSDFEKRLMIHLYNSIIATR
ncbi:hypothetical protein AXF42_Ash001874 [Apostasia shenzhenica]|uniref:Uncharacterized protein n=1 Tax=Apostasia shenzhenica TaxID=1088818 RepID=A0A2I0ABG8_9ASPA|nr:hypothetical protein AXF42_Ash001874 [Apostasia shenzhenica]